MRPIDSLTSLVRPSAVVVAVASLACAPDPGDKDRTPPRVLSVAPASPLVPVDARFAFTFSEALDESTLDVDPVSETTTIALVARARAASLFTDLNTAGLNETNQDDAIGVDLIVEGPIVTIAPRARLDPDTAYSVVVSADVRDAAQNPIVDALGLAAPFRYDLTTDAGPPSVLSADVGTSSQVAPNRKRIAVTFNQPVIGVTGDTLTLTPAVDVEAIVVDAAVVNDNPVSIASIVLAEGAGCERLSPSTTYTLSATAGIRAENGQTLSAFSTTFTTGAACDTTPLAIVDGPDVIAGEIAATIRFETNKASTTEVRFGVPGSLDCLGAACPAQGNAARTAIAGSSPPRFLHSVEVVGLQVGQAYEVVVSAEDDVGFTTRGTTSFVTAPLPKVAINEVMANATTPEAGGEFVELANFGEVAVDVSGWGLLVNGGADADGCTAVLAEGAVLPPGAFLVVAQDDFDERYGLSPDVVVMKLADACTLANSARPIALVDSDGRPVSSMSAFPSTNPSRDGIAVERTTPDAPDVETSFCRARADVAATPGRTNSVTSNGCAND